MIRLRFTRKGWFRVFWVDDDPLFPRLITLGPAPTARAAYLLGEPD